MISVFLTEDDLAVGGYVGRRSCTPSTDRAVQMISPAAGFAYRHVVAICDWVTVHTFPSQVQYGYQVGVRITPPRLLIHRVSIIAPRESVLEVFYLSVLFTEDDFAVGGSIMYNPFLSHLVAAQITTPRTIAIMRSCCIAGRVRASNTAASVGEASGLAAAVPKPARVSVRVLKAGAGAPTDISIKKLTEALVR